MINFDRHIEILLLSNDCVIVPDFGGFMAHHIDARKDESDGSFLPPIRSIGFNPRLTLNDSLLAQSYVEAYDISYPDAVMRIEDEVRELRQRIDSYGKYEFAGIGTVSLNNDGKYEFTPCEAGIISPELYGLGSFHMQTLTEINEATQATHTIAPQTPEISQSTNVGFTTGNDSNAHAPSARIISIWRNVAVACIAIIFFLLMPSPLVNSTQMAGNHIDTNLLDRILLPKDITMGQDKANKLMSKVETAKVMDEEVGAEETRVKETSQGIQDVTTNEKCFSIVLASRVTIKNAETYVEDLHKRGYKEAFVHRNGHVKVLLGRYTTREEASKALNTLSTEKEFSEVWITQVKF